jgi:hypothetical protein
MRTLATLTLGTALVLSAARAAEVGPENLLPASPLPAHDPCVAHGENGYLAVWQSGLAEKADLYACRVDEAGKAADAKPFAISTATECQERPRAAWGKGIWLVVWADLRNDKDYDVYAARVSADGKVLDPEGILVAGGAHNQCQPDVTWNGENFLVIWRNWVAEGGAGDINKYMSQGARVSPDGKLLDAAPTTIYKAKYWTVVVGPTCVTACGGQWLVVIATNYTGTNRPGSAEHGMHVVRVGADGKVAGSEQIMNNEARRQTPVAAAGDGKSGCLVSWSNHQCMGRAGATGPYGAIRIGPDGKRLGTVVLGTPVVQRYFTSVAWDGKGYLVTYWDGQAKGVIWNGQYEEPINFVRGQLVSADGKYEGAVEIVPTGGANPPYAPSSAGDGRGSTLVVYERHPDKAGETILIATRLVKR